MLLVLFWPIFSDIVPITEALQNASVRKNNSFCCAPPKFVPQLVLYNRSVITDIVI